MHTHLLQAAFLQKIAVKSRCSVDLRCRVRRRRELVWLVLAVTLGGGYLQTADGAPTTFCFSGTVTDPGATTLAVGEVVDGSFEADDVSSGSNGNATFYPLASAKVSAATFGTLEWNGTGSASVGNDLQGSNFTFDEFDFNASLGSPEVGIVLIQTRDNDATLFASEALPATSLQLSDLEVRHLEVVFHANGPWGNSCDFQPGDCFVTAALTKLDVAESCGTGGVQPNLSLADPGVYPDNTDLTAAFPGVALSLESPVITGSITNSTKPGSGVSFFIQKFDGGSVDDTWTDDPGFPRYFRAQFSSPVSHVSIEMYRSQVCDHHPDSACSGVLEAYDSGAQLVESVTTGPLTGYWTDPPAVAEIGRSTADIAYIRAYGTGGALYPSGGIVLSRMQYGVVQSGSDVDLDGIPDIQDPCPADPANVCNAAGSAAAEVSAGAGGSVTTPDGALSLGIEPGDLAADATLSVTESVPGDPNVDIGIGSGPALGTALSVYDLEPDGLQFDSPITLVIIADVTALDEVQRANIDVYRFEDTDADSLPDTFAPQTATCGVIEDPVGTFTAT